MQISQRLYNDILEKALLGYFESPEKGAFAIADDCCRPYLKFFGSDMNSYEELVFQVTSELAPTKE